MAIGELAVRYDAFVVTDEVYEHIIFQRDWIKLV